MAARSERRDPTKPGLAGIAAGDWAALAEGRVTVGELATRVGVSPAAVSKRRQKLQKRQAAGKGTTPSPPAAGAEAGPLPPKGADCAPNVPTTSPTSLPDLVASFAMWSLYRSHEALAGGGLGPAAIKSATAAGVMALEELRRGGFLDVEDQAAPVELKVSVLTDEEVAELKARHVELGDDDA